MVLLAACAVYQDFQVGLSYRPSTTLQSYYALKKPISVALAPFTDQRAEKKLLFKRYNKLGGEDRYYLRDERLDMLFTAAIRNGMQEAGVKVVDVPSGDKNGTGLAAPGVQGVLTGAIEEFSCEREVGTTPLSPVLVGRARLRLYWGNAQGRVIKEEVLEARFRSEEFLFVTEAEVEHILNQVMGDLVERIVKSKVISEMTAK